MPSRAKPGPHFGTCVGWIDSGSSRSLADGGHACPSACARTPMGLQRRCEEVDLGTTLLSPQAQGDLASHIRETGWLWKSLPACSVNLHCLAGIVNWWGTGQFAQVYHGWVCIIPQRPSGNTRGCLWGEGARDSIRREGRRFRRTAQSTLRTDSTSSGR